MMKFFKYLVLAGFVIVACTAQSAMAQPGPGPGPSGGGPVDPPRDTPGLDPVTLGLLATGSYAGYQYLKTRSGKPGQ